MRQGCYQTKVVMAGPDPAIKRLSASQTLGGWMAAARAAMTKEGKRV